MQPESRDRAWLWDMLEASEAIQQFIDGRTFSDYQDDHLLRSAVERQIEIIGEASRRISPATREAHPQIPWHGIIGQRNVLAHEYDSVLHESVWALAVRRIPELARSLKIILDSFDDDGRDQR
jgi:uncharacterized protein with HEPN domain